MARGEAVLLALLDSSAPDARRVLDTSSLHCEHCTGNFLGGPFGCAGRLPAPLDASAEEWLCASLAPLDSFGGSLLDAAIRELPLTGGVVAEWRAAGALSDPAGVSRVLSWEARSVPVSSAQILEALLAVPLTPGHAVGVLLWHQLLEVDGAIPSDARVLGWLGSCEDPEELANRVGLRLADAPQGLAELFSAIYVAWMNRVALCVETE